MKLKVGMVGVVAVAYLTLILGMSGAASTYLAPPGPTSATLQWYWQISSPVTQGQITSGVTSTANIFDTDEFEDSSTLGVNNDPSGPSAVVEAIHAANKYSICYVEAGAYQTGFPDDSNFAAADYGSGAQQYEMQGYPNEWWFDTRGFAGFSYGDSNSILTGTASNIATGMAQRIAGCKAEGQDAIEPDDLDGYTNSGDTGVAGGGWGLTQTDAAGYEAWLATTAHADGLAIFQKNDGGNTSVDEPNFDGMIIEECNHYDDPCGSGGDNVQDYINAGKPVLDAEYTQDGEITARFCSADIAAGMTGALFDVNLAGGTYEPCQTGAGYTYGGRGSTTTTSSTPSTSTSSASSRSSTTTSTTLAPGAKPVSVKPPTITGRPKEGYRLTATSDWYNQPTRLAWSWSGCLRKRSVLACRVVSNAHKSRYTVGRNDLGRMMRVTVTAFNAYGSTTATSARTKTIKP